MISVGLFLLVAVALASKPVRALVPSESVVAAIGVGAGMLALLALGHAG